MKKEIGTTLGKTIGEIISGLILIVILCVGLGYYLTKVQNTNKENQEKYNSVIYNMGDVLECNNFKITVDNVQTKPKGTKIDSYFVIGAPEWIGVTVTVTNTSDKERTFYTSNFELKNTSGEMINYTSATYKMWGVENFGSPTLSAGGHKTGYVQFDNTETDNSGLRLKVSCGSLSSKYFWVDISK